MKGSGKPRRSFLKSGLLAGAGAWSFVPVKAGVSTSGRAEKSELAIDPDPEILFERVEKIVSDGRWNGRPSVVFWKGRYWLSFSSAVKHIDLDSKILMMRSKGREPRDWSKPTTVLDTLERCDVECHLLATPDRLFAYIVQEEPVAGKPGEFRAAGTLVVYTEDGERWSEPRPAYDPPWSLWKPKTHAGIHYVAADIMEGNPRLDLLESHDGLRWNKVSTILEGEYTETALLFLPDDSLLAFTRQGPGPSISHARPPYSRWKVYEGPKMGGPDAVLVGNTILVTGRSYNYVYPDDQLIGTAPKKSIQRTALWTFDMDRMRVKWKMHMPTQFGGDVSYPHFLVLDDRRVLMLWYDGEGYLTADDVRKVQKSDVFLAVLRVQSSR